MIETIPKEVKTLLWDAKIEDISLKDHAKYIIERVLEFGDINEDKWLKKVYTQEEIIEVIKKSKQLSEKTANFYAILFNIDKSDVECLKNPYTQRQNRF